MELSHFGAKVLYPPTIQPALKKEIPICIKNTFDATAEGTLITKVSENTNPIKGISHIENMALITLEGSGMVGIPGFSKRLFGALSEQKINVSLITQASSEHSICIAISNNDVEKAKEAINIEFNYEMEHHKVDELTIDRFNLVKRLNPTWDVVSVRFNGYDLLPNSLFVNREIYPKNKELVEVDNLHNEDWSNPDFFLYSGYSEFSNYDEYFLYEYDTISNVGIEEFFNTDVDFFGNGIRSPADEEWWWVKQYRKLNNE